MYKTMTLEELSEELKTETDQEKRTEIRMEAIDRISDEILSDVTELVASIEAKPETTKGHYGDYLSLITSYQGIFRPAVYLALKKAGANPEGLEGVRMILSQ